MLLRAFVLIAFALALAGPVSAFEISQKMSIAQLGATCQSVGGTFQSDAGLFGTCTKKNCDGKGGDCVVVCDHKDTCHGKTPNLLRGSHTLLSILQNGNGVRRDPGAIAGGSMSSPVNADAPAAPPPLL